MKYLRVLSGDPGRVNDPFGVVGLEAIWPKKKIHIKLAKQFKRQKYRMVAVYFKKAIKKIHPDLVLIEKNFDYDRLNPAFVKLPITYVTMSTGLTEKTRMKGYSIDKTWVIRKIDELHKRHAIVYPEKLTRDMQELINQRNEMVSVNGSYKRKRSRHDDLFMAKLIGINAILLWWDNLDNNLDNNSR